MSKRTKPSSSRAPKTKAAKTAKTSSSWNKGTILEQIIELSGITMQDGVFVVQDVFMTQRNLLKLLGKYRPQKTAVIDGVEEVLGDPSSDMFVAILSPMKDRHSENSVTDSVIKLMLRSPVVQKDLLRMLVQLFPQFEVDSEDDLRNFRLVLEQVRWLGGIQDSVAFTESLMQSLDACPSETQREIIPMLPEIIDDYGHKTVCEALTSLLDDEPAYMSIILETLGCLNLTKDTFADVRDQLVKQIASARTEHLPKLMSFLLQRTEKGGLSEVITALRMNLNLSSAPLQHNVSATQSAPSKAQKKDRAMSFKYLTLEALRMALSWDEQVASAFFKAIAADEDHASEIDIWVLLMLHPITKMKSKVETLFRKKISSGQFTMSLLSKAMARNGEILDSCFSAFTSLCEKLVRSPENALRDFGSLAYSLNYGVFVGENRKALLGVLITHMGSESEDECRAALRALSMIAENTPLDLKSNMPYIEGILDYLSFFSTSNVRLAWRMFASLMWQDVRGGQLDEKVFSMLRMLVRKQLGNARLEFKQSGISGAAMVLGELGAQHQTRADHSKDFDQLLDALLNHCCHAPPLMAAAYDELSTLLDCRKLTQASVERISGKILASFSEDTIDEVPRDFEALMGLNQEEDNQVSVLVINIWHLCDPKLAGRELTLAPKFRLVSATEKQRSGQLDGIDAILGAPMLLYPRGMIENFEDVSSSDQLRVCQSLWVAINWTREVIAQYSDQQSLGIQQMVLTRLSNLRELEQLLDMCIGLIPMNDRPIFHNMRDPLSGVTDQQSKKTKLKKPKKRSKVDDEAASTSSFDDDLVHVDHLREVMRPFPLHVARVFAFKNSDQRELVVLRPFACHLILSEFAEAINCLYSFKKRSNPFGSKKASSAYLGKYDNEPIAALTEVILPLLPGLCEAATYLSKQIIAFNDENNLEVEIAFDMPDALNENMTEMQSSTRDYYRFLLPDQILVFEVFSKLLHYLKDASAVVDNETAKVYSRIGRQVLAGISGRTIEEGGSGGSGSSQSLDNLKKAAFNYLKCFLGSLVTYPGAQSCVDVLQAVADFRAGRQQRLDGEEKSQVELDLLHNVSSMCGNHLSQPSADTLKSAQLRFFLSKYIDYHPQPARTIRGVSARLHAVHNKQTGDGDDDDGQARPMMLDDESSGFGLSGGGGATPGHSLLNIGQGNFAAAYKQTMISLGDHLKTLIVSIETDIPEKSLKRLHMAAHTLNTLVTLSQSSSKAVMASTLKDGKVFIDRLLLVLDFISQCMKMPNLMSQATKILSRFQASTRFLQRLCAHCKTDKDKKLLPLVPPLKKSLEIFVVGVQKSMRKGGLGSAMTVGHVRHRLLDGEVAASQVAYYEEEELEEEDEDDEEHEEDNDDSKGKEEEASSEGLNF